MAGFRPIGYHGGLSPDRIMPGDLIIGGESVSAGTVVTSVGTTIPGSAFATGIIRRSGPTLAFTDSIDSAANILAALAGNGFADDLVPGNSARILIQNTTTVSVSGINAGTGIVLNSGTMTIPGSNAREYLMTIQNASAVQTFMGSTSTGTSTSTFILPANAVSLPLQSSGGNFGAVAVTPGMSVSGTGIPSGTTVLGLLLGVGGATGVQLSTTASANASVASGGTLLTFSPTVMFDGLFSMPL